jgi:hypothetical protein
MVGLLPHIHGIWDFVRPPLTEFDADGEVLADRSEAHVRIRGSGENLEGPTNGRRVVGMMVTLSHTMLFFSPEDTKADEWMLSELESHWTGQGRGSITQKIWSKNGKLLAFCTQEVRSIPGYLMYSSWNQPANMMHRASCVCRRRRREKRVADYSKTAMAS